MHDIAVTEHGRNSAERVPLDPRHALLAQAGAWDVLVAQGEIALNDAFGRLVGGVDELAGLPPCEACLDRAAGKLARKSNRLPEDWDRMSIDALFAHFNRNRPTPQATIE